MIKDFITAAFRFGDYEKLYNRRARRAVLYSIVLVLMVNIIFVFVPMGVKSIQTIRLIWEDIPEFTLTNGELIIEKDFEVDFGGARLMATNSRELTEEDLKDNISGAIFDRNSLVFKSFVNVAEFEYSELFEDDITYTKSDLEAFEPILLGAFITGFVMTLLTIISSYFISALLVAALTNLIAGFINVRLPFGRLYVLSLYAKTLMLLAEGVLSFVGIAIPSIGSLLITVYIMYMFVRTKREEFANTDI